MGKSETMSLLSSPRNKWENNTIVGRKVVGWKRVRWIDLAWNKDKWRTLVKTVMNIRRQ